MRVLVFMLAATCSIACGQTDGDAIDIPDVVAKMAQGLTDSKIEHLTSRVFKDGEQEFSYHLKTISYLGTVNRDGRRFTIAITKFIRSSAKGSQYPPARGHSFLVMFDDSFAVATHGRLDFADYHMDHDTLKLGDAAVVDFGTTEPLIRFRGWLLDSAFMAYPFADRISEEDWESGAFREKPDTRSTKGTGEHLLSPD